MLSKGLFCSLLSFSVCTKCTNAFPAGSRKKSSFPNVFLIWNSFSRYHRVWWQTVPRMFIVLKVQREEINIRLCFSVSSRNVLLVLIVKKQLHHNSIHSIMIIYVRHVMKHVFHANVALNVVQWLHRLVLHLLVRRIMRLVSYVCKTFLYIHDRTRESNCYAHLFRCNM